MRISALSEATGVPVATIKYYLREGLLPPGERTSATQARYDAGHVARLQLIRALVGVGGLSVARAREVLAVYDQPPADVLTAVGTAQAAVAETGEPAVDVSQARELIDRLGWRVVDPCGSDLQQLARALEGLAHGGITLVEGGVESYARWVESMAAAELDTVPDDDPATAVRQAVMGTLLVEPVLVALRRLAHQSLALQRWEEASAGGTGNTTAG